MHTFDQVLWFKSDKKSITYRVKDSDGLLLLPWKRIGSLGKLAARYRNLGEKHFLSGLPELPVDIWDAILAIAAHQSSWAKRQEEAAEEDKYANVGKWND